MGSAPGLGLAVSFGVEGLGSRVRAWGLELGLGAGALDWGPGLGHGVSSGPGSLTQVRVQDSGLDLGWGLQGQVQGGGSRFEGLVLRVRFWGSELKLMESWLGLRFGSRGWSLGLELGVSSRSGLNY